MAGVRMPVSANGKRRAERLLKRLGYTRQAGWIDASAFAKMPTHRFAMLQAKREMSVIGAFCLKSPNGGAGASVTPLVYVALARDGDSAKEVHRKIWSQGLVPFGIIVMPEEVGRLLGIFIFAPGTGNPASAGPRGTKLKRCRRTPPRQSTLFMPQRCFGIFGQYD